MMIPIEEELGCYCENHANELIDKYEPEYNVRCPNCNCYFGIF